MIDCYSDEIEAQTIWFETQIVKVGRKLRNRINSMLNKLDRENGMIDYSNANLEFASQVYFSLMEELEAAGYYRAVNELQGKENDLLRMMKANRPEGSVPVAFTMATRAKIDGLNSMYLLKFNGVGEDAMRNIAGIVMDIVVRGGSLQAAIKQIEGVLEKNLVRYATTYCETSRAHFLQAVEYAHAEDYEGEKFWQYVGPFDDLNRPACIEGLNVEFFTDAEREQFEAETAEERMYNCRHTFLLINKEFYLANVK